LATENTSRLDDDTDAITKLSSQNKPQAVQSSQHSLQTTGTSN